MPERYFLIAAKGDDVLDYKEAVKHIIRAVNNWFGRQ